MLTCVAGQAVAARPLVTAIHEPNLRQWWSAHPLLFDRVERTGSKAIRIWLDWKGVAPSEPTNAADPADPAYVWTHIDLEVTAARARGLRVIFTIREAPSWAERPAGGRQGSNNPDAGQFGLFVRAAALRYQGQVFDWEIWNEPNLSYFFVPQRDGAGASVAPTLYRDLVNAAAASLRAVDARNRVVAGALAPFGAPDGHMPLDFMRRLLCMSRGKSPRPVCSNRVAFDVWSTHPYTQGGPEHDAYWPDDVSLGDLGEMRRLLNAAVRAGNVDHTKPVGFWVTEFSWETRPPDPLGIPTARHARWTSEALYRMWRSGVSLVTWWLLRDRPFPVRAEQSGLFYCGAPTTADDSTCWNGSVVGDVAKGRTIRALRFPFVAFPRDGRLFVWGRTPSSEAARVVIQVRYGSRWRTVARLGANQRGIFTRTLRVSASRRQIRARAAGDTSVPFRAARTRDIPLSHPFGCGGGLPC